MDQQDLQDIEAANKGDTRALESIYHRHKKWVYSQAWRYCRNEADAMDVSQETFQYLFAKFPGFTLTCRLHSFLYPVIRNKSLNLLKKKRRHDNEDIAMDVWITLELVL